MQDHQKRECLAVRVIGKDLDYDRSVFKGIGRIIYGNGSVIDPFCKPELTVPRTGRVVSDLVKRDPGPVLLIKTE